MAALTALATACGIRAPRDRTLEIVASDYAFQAPDTIEAGRVVLRLRNAGKVRHEMIVMKLRPEATVRQVVTAQERGETVRPFVEGGSGVVFADSSRTGSGELAVTFEPGRDYLLWCNFTDGDGKPRHATLGMFKRIHVRESAAANAAAVQELFVDAIDYAFRVPDTVRAGLTHIRMRNVGQRRHELAFSRLKAGITPAFFFSEAMKDRNVDSLYDDDGIILTGYGGDTNQLAIRAMLESGRSYIMVCEFRDSDSSQVHAALGMFKGLVVR